MLTPEIEYLLINKNTIFLEINYANFLRVLIGNYPGEYHIPGDGAFLKYNTVYNSSNDVKISIFDFFEFAYFISKPTKY